MQVNLVVSARKLGVTSCKIASEGRSKNVSATYNQSKHISRNKATPKTLIVLAVNKFSKFGLKRHLVISIEKLYKNLKVEIQM